MANSLVGCKALLRQLPSFCKGWVGDHCRDHSICIMAYMDSRGWGELTPPIYIYVYQLSYTFINYYTYIYSLYNIHATRFGHPQTKFLATPMYFIVSIFRIISVSCNPYVTTLSWYA